MNTKRGRRRSLALVLLAGLVHVGCSSTAHLANMSSGEVGCKPDDIVISGDHSGIFDGGGRTWTAVCNDKIYYCSAAGQSVKCKQPDDGTG